MLSTLGAFLFSSSIHTQVGVRLLVASLELAVLALLLEALTQTFRRRPPRLKSILWTLVLIKPLFTLFIGAPFVIASFEIASETVAPSAITNRFDRGVPGTDAAPGGSESRWNSEAGEIHTDSSAFSWLTFRMERARFLTGLTCCWILGICVGAIRWLLAGRRLKSIIERTTDPSERLQSIFDEEVALKKFPKTPRLKITSEVESPVLFGAFNPVVLLPEWLTENDEGQIRRLFRHELTHHEHRDAVCLAINQLCLVLFFFNPIAHWAYRRWLCHTELACDRVLILTEEEATIYAEELFSVLEGMQQRQAALSGLYATRFQIKTRINALLDKPLSVAPGLNSAARTVVVVFAVSLLLLGFAADTKEENGQDDGLMFGTYQPSGPNSGPSSDR